MIQVQSEILAQIARFEELVGKKPFYVDGHQHCHIIPGAPATPASASGPGKVPNIISWAIAWIHFNVC